MMMMRFLGTFFMTFMYKTEKWEGRLHWARRSGVMVRVDE